MPKHKLFVYGTLRPADEAYTYRLSGYDIYNYYGRFPYITPGLGSVRGTVIEVTRRELKQLDQIEGVAQGLYTREIVTVEDARTEEVVECFVYVGGNIVPQLIPSGDWFNR